MVLTEEQKERIRINRERALEIRKRKLEEEEKQQKKGKEEDTKAQEEEQTKKQNSETAFTVDDEELEAFEEGASEYVTKQEAMKMYCLPAGTLSVCEVVEKPNPRNGAWNSMKLYRRSEVRRRARQRFGGLEGLIAERGNRAEKRFEKDLERTKDIFR
jgi:DNA-repair protein complementing XP-A cells